MSKNDFKQLFIEELRDIYSAETQLVKALPKVIKAAENPELKNAVKAHLGETEHQVERLQQIFEILGEDVGDETCEAMEGLLKECDEVVHRYPLSAVRDAALIAAAQRVEHYEIAVYGTLRTFAKQLDLEEIADLLDETLQEEGNANKKLTSIAEGELFTAGINQKAVKR